MFRASAGVPGQAEQPLSPHERLRRDTDDSAAAIDRLRQLAGSNWDEERLLGVVTAAPSSELFLPYTVPLILRQAEASGLGVDILLGLNNGYECDNVLEGFAQLPSVSVVHLETTDKRSLHSPGVVIHPGGSQPFLIGPPDGPHRIFVVHQRRGPWSAGKDAMLLDLFSGCIRPSLERGWRAPRATLVFDAEAIFTEHEPDPAFPADLTRSRRLLDQHHGHPVTAGLALLSEARHEPLVANHARYDVASPGLSRLLDEWRSQPLDVLGPATRFCAFGARKNFRGADVLMPTPAEPISAMHLVYNESCGVLPGCLCMSGAATLARTEVLAGVLDIVLRRYPDVYAEDAIFTVLAERAGLRMRFTRRVQFSNRCPGRDEWTGTPPRQASRAQFAKWYRAFDQVEQMYGAEPCGSVLGPSQQDFLAAGLAIAAQRFRIDGDLGAATRLLHDVGESGRSFDEIRRMAGAAVQERG